MDLSGRNLRLFFAVDLAEEGVARISESLPSLQKALAIPGRRWSWVHPKNYHLTLLFLGSFPESKVDELLAVTRTALTRAAPFSFEASGLGSFPRAVYVSIGDSERRLATLASRIAEATTPLGIAAENREFIPHLTLGRLKEGRAVSKDELHAFSKISFGVSVVNRVSLYLSEPGAGAFYQRLSTLPL